MGREEVSRLYNQGAGERTFQLEDRVRSSCHYLGDHVVRESRGSASSCFGSSKMLLWVAYAPLSWRIWNPAIIEGGVPLANIGSVRIKGVFLVNLICSISTSINDDQTTCGECTRRGP